MASLRKLILYPLIISFLIFAVSTSTGLSTGSDVRSSARFKSFDSYGSSSSVSGHIPTPDFSFEDICKATANFSAGNKIGEGGYGTVYKGRLKDGSLVAVKRAKKVHKYICIGCLVLNNELQ